MNSTNRHLELINGYCSGSLDEQAFAELETALRGDQGLRRQLLEHRMLDSGLRGIASADLRISPSSDEHKQGANTPLQRRFATWALAAAIAALSVGFTFWVLRRTPSNRIARVQPILDHGVAVLTKVVDAKWQGRVARQGDSMAPGPWNLLSGVVELEFYSGASVILEAPARLEIVSANRGILHAGKMRAQVPLHAQGFTMNTNEVQLVDLGTSFGMQVSPDTGTAVHVFDGMVELFETGRERRLGEGYELFAGEGRHVDRMGEASTIEVSPAEFMSPAEIERRLQVRSQRRHEIWQSSTSELRDDDRLLARYDFERSDDARTLANRSRRMHDGLNGAIIGARWCYGRWPTKGAIDFKRPGDRIRIEVPGKSSSLTMAAWLRIDGFDNQFHSLLLSDGWDRLGAVHWQIHRDGFVELAVWHSAVDRTNNSRASFEMRPSDFGRWMQLAVVYDGESSTVTHYRDGELLGSALLPTVVPLEIAKAEIANWTPPLDSSRQVRHFNGRMDEMLIFDSALPANEIVALYENGKP
ncbi:MAG: LamG domain-containing protein [Planctomycetota bacterium]